MYFYIFKFDIYFTYCIIKRDELVIPTSELNDNPLDMNSYFMNKAERMIPNE